ncbi:hypothetical protein A2223_01915 [Candidatus Falkowbacteria bacterium RIFOXYA2_FULL_35_8]|uniref:Ribosome-binding factor A n=1 Tax=Candidatus Falkowbacteria bacterium RIFOXYC2_FULL_36_12 TaxID=1798002 RepID=A0A1F5T328_9BACT|nr:MAG: hypothetical protein A2478_01445 [Candidatus Falkowbacteria bacterium RIFOXYC2_FULL_36_12]OGF33977.1 MAG: hypothetical protein A2223_01915 [Candidatus Falkowbacteria bacterium RIFOXYA2_FULL_35_8]
MIEPTVKITFMTDRMLQINVLLQRAIAEIITYDIELPQEYLVTVTRVKTGADLRAATAFLSILPMEHSREAMAYIIRNRKLIQKQLGDKVQLRFTPKVLFKVDVTEQKAAEINDILDRIKEE